MESAPRAKRKPASRLTRGAPNIPNLNTRPPVKSQYSGQVDVARRAARCVPSVAVSPGYLQALACIISSRSHRVEEAVPTTSCCFAFLAITELMPPDERREGRYMDIILQIAEIAFVASIITFFISVVTGLVCLLLILIY